MVDLVKNKIDELRDFMEVLNIKSVKDIPTRNSLTKKLQSGDFTFRDAWFAKAYDQGLNVSGALFKDSRALDVKEIANHLKKEFPLRITTGQGIGPMAKTIKQIQKKFDSLSYNQSFLDANPVAVKNLIEQNDIFTKSGKQITALYGSIESIKVGSLGKTVAGQTRIFNAIPDDKIIGKILEGISEIPNQAHRELLLLNLFGTRGQQNLEMVASRDMALDVDRPFYGRESGTVHAVDVMTGRKPLATVPFGPFMRDMLDNRYDRMTLNGTNTYIEMWKDIDSNFDMGKLVNEFLFNDVGGKSVLSDEEISKLGRKPNGFTDLRRLVLSWASKLDNPALAAELLTHGTAKSHDALDLVTNKHYIPSEGTPENVMRKFTTRIEQKVAQVLGHTTYASFNKEVRVRKNSNNTSGVKFGKNVVIPKVSTIINPDIDDVKLDSTSIDETGLEDEVESLYEDRQENKRSRYREDTGIRNARVEDQIKNNYEKNIKLDPDYTMEDAKNAIVKGKYKAPEKPNEVYDKLSNALDNIINKGKTQAREIVGDISTGVDRLASKSTYKETAEMFLDPAEWQKTAKQLAPLGMLVGGKFAKVGRAAYGVGKAIIKPSPGTLGRSEVTLESMATLEEESGMADKRREFSDAKERKKDAQSLADIEYNMQQNQSQIGDGKLPVDEQMKKFGF